MDMKAYLRMQGFGSSEPDTDGPGKPRENQELVQVLEHLEAVLGANDPDYQQYLLRQATKHQKGES